MKICIINGPNLNTLGTREQHIYGSKTLEDINKIVQNHFPNIEFIFFQSNIEGEIINQIQQASKICDGIIINPAGYSHTSVSIADAISSINTITIEVHLTNIHSREEYRHKSLTGSKCKGIICGFGYNSYILAVHALILLLTKEDVRA